MSKKIISFALCITFPLTIASPQALSGFQSETAFAAAAAAAPALKDEKSPVPYLGTGEVYQQPRSIAPLFPAPAVQFDTPAFQKDRAAFTSQEEMMAFVKKLENKYPHVRLEIIGQSLEGRDIPLLILSRHPDQVQGDKTKPTVWLQAQIHGNEPASGESALVIAKWLAEEKLGSELLDQVHVIIVPRINPDGSYRFQRTVAVGQDANRDYMRAEYPEVQAIHKAFDRFQPDVVLDAHEYGVASASLAKTGEKGAISSYDVLISSAKNLNIPKELRSMSDQLLLPEVEKALDEAQLTHHPYYTLSLNQKGQITATEGSTETRIGRNALGLKNSLSFLVETRGIGIGRADFARRVYAQAKTHSAFILATARHRDTIKQTVANSHSQLIARGKKADDDDRIVVTSENKRMTGHTLDVIDLAEARRVSIPIAWVSATDAFPTLERKRPTAYLMPSAYHHIADRLKLLGVKIATLSEPATLRVESYLVTDNKVQTRLENGRFPNHVETSVTEENVFFPAGSYVFAMDQSLANFIALTLEPESVDSFVTNGYLPVQKGDRIPVYRYMSEGSLPLIPHSSPSR
ncbi:M14 family metallopeptidase [Brevibacillus borstelensis]|uniref:M14 family metallopeptidase n=1 Tax=Brevibacillus borstelensis TaxID=45462 RepID=UPI0030C3CAF0